MPYWLFKSEPETWGWQQQIKRGRKGEPWDGVRNYQANNMMKQMRIGDRGFFYHSVKERRIVGSVQIIREHYPDPSDASGRFGMVDVVALEEAKTPITLDDIKADEALRDMILVKQARLSVQPVQAKEWQHICKLCGLSATRAKSLFF
ncbi:MAG: EVE domain-containing protein [Alphaproteobacteria bacterium]|nr:EVE domain-containing protein [Alphaproteobacteria bacterium]